MARQLKLDTSIEGVAPVVAGFEGMAKGIDKAGDQAKQTERELSRLSRQITETQAKMALLTKQFNETGDSKFIQEFTKERKATAGLREMQRELERVATAEKKAAAEAENLAKKAALTAEKERKEKFDRSATGRALSIGGKTFDSLPLGLSHVPLGAIAPAGAAAAAIGGGLASTAVLGTAGLSAVIAGAILAATSSDRVKQAWSGLGHGLLAQLQEDAQSFRQPLVEAAGIVGESFERQEPRIRSLFESASRYVEPLTKGFSGFLEELLPGFETAVKAADPLIKEIGRDLPEIGRSLGNFFAVISKAAPGATRSFEKLAESVEFVTESTGGTVVAMSKLSEGLAKIDDYLPLSPILGFWRAARGDGKAAENVDDYGGALGAVAAAANKTTDQVIRLEGEVRDLNKDINDLFNVQVGAKEAAIGWEEALDNLRDSVNQNGHSLDIHNKQGRENAKTLLAAADAAKAMRDSNIASGQSAEEANRRYQDQVAALVQLAIKLGFSSKAVRDLIGGLAAIPAAVNTDVNVKLQLQGFSQDDIREAARARLPSQIKVPVKGAFASGGPVDQVPPGQPMLAIVHGGEYVLPRTAVRRAGDGGSMGGASAVLQYSGTPSGLEAIHLSWLQEQLRTGRLVVAQAMIRA